MAKSVFFEFFWPDHDDHDFRPDHDDHDSDLSWGLHESTLERMRSKMPSLWSERMRSRMSRIRSL